VTPCFPQFVNITINGQKTMENFICVNIDSMDLCLKGKRM
jgi:hypothetical protein